jgi:hypothetical protein
MKWNLLRKMKRDLKHILKKECSGTHSTDIKTYKSYNKAESLGRWLKR